MLYHINLVCSKTTVKTTVQIVCKSHPWIVMNWICFWLAVLSAFDMHSLICLYYVQYKDAMAMLRNVVLWMLKMFLNWVLLYLGSLKSAVHLTFVYVVMVYITAHFIVQGLFQLIAVTEWRVKLVVLEMLSCFSQIINMMLILLFYCIYFEDSLIVKLC